jgi:ribosome biogenesis GTPase
VPEGTVVEYHREYCWVELDPDRREVIAKPRGRLELDETRLARQVAVGDRVRVDQDEGGSFVIEELLARETWLLRKNTGSYSRKPQCIVANADQLAVVAAPNPTLNIEVVDRFFLAAILGGLEPFLIVNKVDLQRGVETSSDVLVYRRLGYPVHFTCGLTGEGMDELAPALAGKLTAFCGHSGVGKSTLLARLTGRELAVAEVSEKHLQGRHTTRASRIYHLDNGGSVVDTPGIREFLIPELEWTDVHEFFADVADLTARCQFRNCLHTVEPGCAVREAIKAGTLPPGRLRSYVALRRESTETDY